MLKIIITAATIIFVSSTAFAQQDSSKAKKGGFLKALKKGVESTTGLKVSDETLFVYPEIATWKMELVSCEGDKETGTVQIIVNGTHLSGNDNYYSSWGIISEAEISGTKTPLNVLSFSASPLYKFEKGIPTTIKFNKIEAPLDSKTIDIKFHVNIKSPKTSFEARRIPITWK